MEIYSFTIFNNHMCSIRFPHAFSYIEIWRIIKYLIYVYNIVINNNSDFAFIWKSLKLYGSFYLQ